MNSPLDEPVARLPQTNRRVKELHPNGKRRGSMTTAAGTKASRPLHKPRSSSVDSALRHRNKRRKERRRQKGTSRSTGSSSRGTPVEIHPNYHQGTNKESPNSVDNLFRKGGGIPDSSLSKTILNPELPAGAFSVKASTTVSTATTKSSSSKDESVVQPSTEVPVPATATTTTLTKQTTTKKKKRRESSISTIRARDLYVPDSKLLEAERVRHSRRSSWSKGYTLPPDAIRSQLVEEAHAPLHRSAPAHIFSDYDPLYGGQHPKQTTVSGPVDTVVFYEDDVEDSDDEQPNIYCDQDQETRRRVRRNKRQLEHQLTSIRSLLKEHTITPRRATRRHSMHATYPPVNHGVHVTLEDKERKPKR